MHGLVLLSNSVLIIRVELLELGHLSLVALGEVALFAVLFSNGLHLAANIYEEITHCPVAAVGELVLDELGNVGVEGLIRLDLEL